MNLKKKSSFLSFSRSVTWRHGFYIYPVALFVIVISDVLRKLNCIQFSLIAQQQPLLWNLIALRNAKKHKLLPEFKKKSPRLPNASGSNMQNKQNNFIYPTIDFHVLTQWSKSLLCEIIFSQSPEGELAHSEKLPNWIYLKDLNWITIVGAFRRVRSKRHLTS